MPEPQRKIFVLDTSVILYDFNALQNFQEHDVAIPITVLEELDTFKKGNSVLNLQAREFIRQLDKLAGHAMLDSWIPLDGPARGKFRVLTDENAPVDAVEVFGNKKADHRILNAALSLARTEPDRKIVLVSKSHIFCFCNAETEIPIMSNAFARLGCKYFYPIFYAAVARRFLLLWLAGGFQGIVDPDGYGRKHTPRSPQVSHLIAAVSHDTIQPAG